MLFLVLQQSKQIVWILVGMNIGTNVATINPPPTIASKAADDFSFGNFMTDGENNVFEQLREDFLKNTIRIQ
jgi:hypothetical protein